MAGLFSRLKIWNPGESLTASDLNGEFNHFLSNIDAEHSEGYSANLSEMQTTENPGGLGSENLTQPISMAQEIERLRYVINRIIGKSYWYQTPAQSLEGLNNTISGVFGVSPSRVVSGQKTALSGFPTFLQANGASGVRLNASSGTPFNCFIDTNYFSYTANISSGVLSAQPSNNTATLASSLGGGQASREATEFTISSAGVGITSNIGRQAIFFIVNGANTEYFLGTIASSTVITGIKRGYFFDSSNAPVPPISLTTGHTITLLRTTYVFIKNDGTLQVSYNPPTYNGTAPASPAINDYWFDVVNSTWKIYTGSWVVANALYIGMCAQGPVNTVCARSENFFNNYSSLNGIVLSELNNSSVSTKTDIPVNISVYGSLIKNDFKDYLWDMTSNLIPGETESANTTYYFYLNNIGTPYISSVRPTNESALYGWYHPYEALRCVGFSVNDGSSNLTTISQNFGISYSAITNPTVQRLTSGSGTYTTPTGVKYIRVKMAGAGGGGAGSGTSGGSPTAGGNTTFGTSLLTANGGSSPASQAVGGAGGTVTINSPAINILASTGGQGGGAGRLFNAAYFYAQGGYGGDSVGFGGGGKSASHTSSGTAGVANTGGGGQGGGLPGGVAGTQDCGGGGGSGGYIDAIIINPLSSYSYSIGTGGTGGTGTQYNGAAGGSGIIVVEEYYQ